MAMSVLHPVVKVCLCTNFVILWLVWVIKWQRRVKLGNNITHVWSQCSNNFKNILILLLKDALFTCNLHPFNYLLHWIGKFILMMVSNTYCSNNNSCMGMKFRNSNYVYDASFIICDMVQGKVLTWFLPFLNSWKYTVTNCCPCCIYTVQTRTGQIGNAAATSAPVICIPIRRGHDRQWQSW